MSDQIITMRTIDEYEHQHAEIIGKESKSLTVDEYLENVHIGLEYEPQLTLLNYPKHSVMICTAQDVYYLDLHVLPHVYEKLESWDMREPTMFQITEEHKCKWVFEEVHCPLPLVIIVIADSWLGWEEIEKDIPLFRTTSNNCRQSSRLGYSKDAYRNIELRTEPVKLHQLEAELKSCTEILANFAKKIARYCGPIGILWPGDVMLGPKAGLGLGGLACKHVNLSLSNNWVISKSMSLQHLYEKNIRTHSSVPYWFNQYESFIRCAIENRKSPYGRIMMHERAFLHRIMIGPKLITYSQSGHDAVIVNPLR